MQTPQYSSKRKKGLLSLRGTLFLQSAWLQRTPTCASSRWWKRSQNKADRLCFAEQDTAQCFISHFSSNIDCEAIGVMGDIRLKGIGSEDCEFLKEENMITGTEIQKGRCMAGSFVRSFEKGEGRTLSTSYYESLARCSYDLLFASAREWPDGSRCGIKKYIKLPSIMDEKHSSLYFSEENIAMSFAGSYHAPCVLIHIDGKPLYVLTLS